MHLFDLVHASNPIRRQRRRPAQLRVRPTVQRILDGLGELPAYIRNGRLDILYANRLGDALYSPLATDGRTPRNVARFVFLDPSAPDFFADWDGIADDAVAILRGEAGRDPDDRRLTDLIGELSTRSDAFRVRWAAHNVKLHRTGAKRLHHPIVGDLTLAYEGLDAPGRPRADDPHLQRRTRLALIRSVEAPRQLGRRTCTSHQRRTARTTLNLAVLAEALESSAGGEHRRERRKSGVVQRHPDLESCK